MRNRKSVPRVGILGNFPLSPNAEAGISNLGRMLEDEFELHLLMSGGPVSERLKKYFKVHQTSIKGYDPANLRYAFTACWKFSKKYQPDLLMNFCSPDTTGFPVSWIGKHLGIPNLVIMSEDTFFEEKLAPNWIKKFKWKVLKYLALQAYNTTDCIVPLGEKLKSDLIKHGYPGEKIKIVPQPIDTDIFTPVSIGNKNKYKQKLNLCSDRNMVLFVGRISWLKGADRLRQIIERVLKESDQFQFCLVGENQSGNLFNDFSQDEVFLAGSILHQEISAFYKAADLMVFPSRVEGLPTTVLEALACQIPIIATPVGEIPNYVLKVVEEVDEFVRHILEKKWTPDPVPKWLDWNFQKETYRNLFMETINDG